MPGLRAWHSRVMRAFAKGAVASVAGLLLTAVTCLPAGAAVAITVPSSANLGSAGGGSTISAKLGTVTVTGSGLVAPSFVATVSTTVFKTGGGTANETIGKASIRYWSGPATAVSGLLGGGTPGQPTASDSVDLTVARTAFSGTGSLLSISVSWNPTLVINLPQSAVVGTYTGTITHSVA